MRIKAGWSIKAGGYIKAGEYIKAGGSIEAGEYIEAGGYIEGGGYIKAGEYIKAGWSIEAGGYILSIRLEIKCTAMITKRLPFWREFYAAAPPLLKWASVIRDDEQCWDDLCDTLTPDEAREIVAWDGWHWIIRAQLSMFLGLETQVVPPAEWRVELDVAKAVE